MTWPEEAEAGGASQASGVHPIEAESYRILRSRIDLSRLPRFSRDVTERVIHASADFDYATDLVCDEEALAAGITGRDVVCKIREPLSARLARTAGITRAAAAIRLAFGEVGPGAVWVVGCAPTALAEILTRNVEPAFVVGLPVGFVGAAEAKDALRASGLRSVTNVSEKGGSAVAAAAVNAMLRAAAGQPDRWRLEVGGSDPFTLTVRAGNGTTANHIREQIFNQFSGR